MKPSKNYIPLQSISPTNGLNTRDPSTMISEDFSPDALNVTFLKGNLKKRGGYTLMGGQLEIDSTPIDDPVLAVIQFEALDGTIWLVAITTKYEFKYDSAGDAWVDITLQTMSVDVQRTGTEEDGIDWDIGTDQNGKWLYITNGVDPPRRWDGSGKFVNIGVDLTDFKTCKTIAIYGDSLFLGNLQFLSVSAEPQSYAWSDTADFISFNTGNAGAQLVPDLSGPIIKLLVFGDRLSIYSKDSVGLISFVGGTQIFTVETYVRGTRILSQRAVTNVELYQFLANSENIYVFDGSRLLRPFGDFIQELYRNEILLSVAERGFIFYDSVETRLLIIVPTFGGGSTVYDAELNLNNFYWDRADTDPYKQGSGRWSRHQLSDRPICFGYYVRKDTLTWDAPELTGKTWADVTGAWNSKAGKAGFPQKVFGSLGKIFLWNELVLTDDGSDVSAYWCTKDFTVPQIYRSIDARWLEIEVEMRGSDNSLVEVAYSTDLGVTYVVADSVEQSFKTTLPVYSYDSHLLSQIGPTEWIYNVSDHEDYILTSDSGVWLMDHRFFDSHTTSMVAFSGLVAPSGPDGWSNPIQDGPDAPLLNMTLFTVTGGTSVQQINSQWRRYKYYIDTISQTFRIRLASSSLSFEARFVRVWLRPESPIGSV